MSGTPRMTDEEFGRVCAILLDEKSGLIDYDDLNKWVAEARRAREAEAELRHEVAEAHGVAQACEQRAEKAEAERDHAKQQVKSLESSCYEWHAENTRLKATADTLRAALEHHLWCRVCAEIGCEACGPDCTARAALQATEPKRGAQTVEAKP